MPTPTTLLRALALFLPLARALPAPQADTPGPPSVQNLTMWGTGCPIGGGAISQRSKDGAPIFVFGDWSLALPSPDEPDSQKNQQLAVDKFCTEEISLANGPPGMQLRIASITVGGWARLDPETAVLVQVETKLGDRVAGKGSKLIGPADLKDNAFEVQVSTAPTDLWSACVDAAGAVPHLTVKTTVGLVGAKLASGALSGGVLGGEKNDLDKALRINFNPVWQPCPA
ncbi:hypothetical protein B0H67DRAFT_477783 [Lasiosphaeris hirsuta]|uniref:Uncharacterized protein n=1 Tax=Lasiosphaeris hirsuta TaxID=260670 RepID=A0AA40BD72_9PEZI|nr:hypothetical protein B0H67DRAFT_477783 [Lasiosphaeris hirsuta]